MVLPPCSSSVRRSHYIPLPAIHDRALVGGTRPNETKRRESSSHDILRRFRPLHKARCCHSCSPLIDHPPGSQAEAVSSRASWPGVNVTLSVSTQASSCATAPPPRIRTATPAPPTTQPPP